VGQLEGPRRQRHERIRPGKRADGRRREYLEEDKNLKRGSSVGFELAQRISGRSNASKLRSLGTTVHPGGPGNRF
jgi:hypothetical protein